MEHTQQHGYYVQVGMHAVRQDGEYNFAIPLYMQVSDEKAYYAGRDKCLRGISQMVIEKYRERLQTTEGGKYGQ